MDDRTGRANHIDQAATRVTGHREHYELPPKSLCLAGTGTEVTSATTGTKTLHRQADIPSNQETSGMIVLDIYSQVTQMIT